VTIAKEENILIVGFHGKIRRIVFHEMKKQGCEIISQA
jgi:hypothetical protein